VAVYQCVGKCFQIIGPHNYFVLCDSNSHVSILYNKSLRRYTIIPFPTTVDPDSLNIKWLFLTKEEYALFIISISFKVIHARFLVFMVLKIQASLLDCDTAQCYGRILWFWRTLVPPSTGWSEWLWEKGCVYVCVYIHTHK